MRIELIESINAQRASRLAMHVAGLWVVAVVAGCATTQQVKVKNQAQTCPFLGKSICGQLTATETPGRLSEAAVTGGGTPVAGLRYINPNAQWTQYKKVMIAPVTFWAGDDTQISAADQQMLTDYGYQAIEQQLSQKFKVVREPGPGVMTIQAALIDAQTATPILRTFSMVVPQARALVTLKYLATGTYSFVGSATGEAKVLDSTTHQVLAAWADRRVGGGNLKTAAQWQWGDAENAMTAWAQQLANRLSSWTSGTPPQQ